MKTALRECRFLNEGHLEALYKAFIDAFSDYVVPFALTNTQFRNHINLNAVDLERSVACFDRDRLIGFSLNGFGSWQDKRTVYDAGTGVIPGFRRQGVSREMFEMMLPTFKQSGIEQCLLEVIATNTGAIDLYEKLGYHTSRELALLQCDGKVISSFDAPANLEINDIAEPDWGLLKSFWDGVPSWQNSINAVQRSRKVKRILGAYLEGKCVGYIVFSSKSGRAAQLAVDKAHRNRGIGTALVRAMQAETADDFSLQIINIDKSVTTATSFFKNRGFYEQLSQYEMVMEL